MQTHHLALLVALVVPACKTATDDDDTVVDTDTDTDTDTDADTDADSDTDALEALRMPPPAEANGTHFASSQVCANCHSNVSTATAMVDGAGRDVGPYDLWQGSMMGHASRDPLFLATLAAEKHATPDAAEAIDAKCLSCHTPLGKFEVTLAGGDFPGASILKETSIRGDLARDSVSCAACHALDPDAYNDDDNWSGNHAYDDERHIYGPHEAPFSGPMSGFADLTVVAEGRIRSGAVCASCHTLQTDALDATGTPTGHTLAEQMPYVEWRSSDFNPSRGADRAATCQNCHMPYTDEDGEGIRTRIARNPMGNDFPRVMEREPYARHLLVGGNTFALGLIRENRELLGSNASDATLAASIEATRDNLATAARVQVGSGTWDGGTVEVPITVINETGHKLPTGYPTRRVWLHVTVQDASGTIVFESGATDSQGHLVGPDGILASERSGGAPLPHVDVIDAPTTVATWQSIMGDPDGERTGTLLRGATYVRDNRILPHGFAPSRSDAPLVATVGVDDPDFSPGQDTVHLRIAPAGTGPWTVQASVRYQSFTPWHLAELVAVDTPESRALGVMTADGIPVETLAETRVSLPAP